MQIAEDFIEVLKMPDVAAKYRALSVEPGGGTPAETAAFIKEKARRWGEVIKKNNIVVDWRASGADSPTRSHAL